MLGVDGCKIIYIWICPKSSKKIWQTARQLIGFAEDREVCGLHSLEQSSNCSTSYQVLNGCHDLGLQFWVLQLKNSSQNTEIHAINFPCSTTKFCWSSQIYIRVFTLVPNTERLLIKSAELEVPLNVLLLIITAPCQAMHIRASAASSVLSLAMTSLLTYQHFSWLAKVATPSQEVISLTSAGILTLFIISLILIFRSL